MMRLLQIKNYQRTLASIVEYMSRAALSCATFVNDGFAMDEETLRARISSIILYVQNIKKSRFIAKVRWAKRSLNAIPVGFVTFLCSDSSLQRQIRLSSYCAG